MRTLHTRVGYANLLTSTHSSYSLTTHPRYLMPRRKTPYLRRIGGEEDEQDTVGSRDTTSGTEETQPRKRVRWGGSLGTQDEDEDLEEEEESSSAEREKVV